MNNYPLISILLPAYNHEQFISRTLDSILADNYPNKELIIIDDGSTDNTGKILEKWIEEHKNHFKIIFESRNNKGVTSTLNDLINLCSGEYLVFIHSDDYLLQDGIIKRYLYLCRNTDKSAVFADCIVVDGENRLITESGLTGFYNADKRKLYADESLKKEIISNWSVPGGTLMVKKKVYDSFKYNPHYLVEDLDFYLRMSSLNQIGFLDEKVSAYRVHGNNTCLLDENFVKVRKALVHSLIRNSKYFPLNYKLLSYLSMIKYYKRILYYQFKKEIKKTLKLFTQDKKCLTL
jgi:glycosyltransferase involved in cell wall biosynthesis